MGSYGPLESVILTKKRNAERGTIGLVGWGTCPSCGLKARISGDQYTGEKSVDCPECEYHETHDHREEADDGN